MQKTAYSGRGGFTPPVGELNSPLRHQTVLRPAARSASNSLRSGLISSITPTPRRKEARRRSRRFSLRALRTLRLCVNPVCGSGDKAVDGFINRRMAPHARGPHFFNQPIGLSGTQRRPSEHRHQAQACQESAHHCTACVAEFCNMECTSGSYHQETTCQAPGFHFPVCTVKPRVYSIPACGKRHGVRQRSCRLFCRNSKAAASLPHSKGKPHVRNYWLHRK